MKQVFLICFSLIWILAIFTDYWNKHILHQMGIEYYSQWVYAIILIAMTIGSGYLYKSESKNKLLKALKSPLMLFPYLLVMLLLIFAVNTKFSLVEFNFATSSSVLWRGIYSLVLLSFIWIVPYSIGNLVRRKVGYQIHKGTSFTVDLVIGLGCYSILLFILSMIHVLYAPSIIILGIVCIGVNYKTLWRTVKDNIIAPTTSEFSWIGWGLFSLIFILFSINYFSDMIPFPNGFDSRNYYMNVTKLIAGNNGMVSGFQPYPWQLFMAQGHLLTNGGGMMPQLISMSTIIFILIGAYEMCTKYLGLSRNHTYLGMVLFLVTPALQNHLFIEIKVDLGLVLTQVAVLILLLDGIMRYKMTGTLPSLLDIVVLGFITGYGVSIKTLNFYLIFALLVAMWSLVFRFKGFLATFCLSIAAILLAKFDSVTGMNQYHLSIDLVMYGCLALGVGGLVWIGATQMQSMIKAVKKSVIYLSIMLLTFSPWLVKNMVETKSMDPNRLIRGSEPGPKINMQLIRKNYPPK